MAKKVIVTIGRQFGSGGHLVGERLAKRLGIEFYDKELLSRAAKESGICEKVLQNYDEKPTNSLLYSIVMDVYPTMAYSGPTLDQQIYQAQFDTLKKIAATESCVIIGRGADYILEGTPGLTSVFIHASRESRIKRISERENLTEAKARDMMNKRDKKRASFYNYQTDKKWGEAASYDLSIDTGILGIDGAVEVICNYLEIKDRIEKNK